MVTTKTSTPTNDFRCVSNQDPGQGDIQRQRPWVTHCESAKFPRLNLSMGRHRYLHATASVKTTDAQLTAQIYLVAGLDKVDELEGTFGAAFQIALDHRNRLNMKHISSA